MQLERRITVALACRACIENVQRVASTCARVRGLMCLKRVLQRRAVFDRQRRVSLVQHVRVHHDSSHDVIHDAVHDTRTEIPLRKVVVVTDLRL